MAAANASRSTCIGFGSVMVTCAMKNVDALLRREREALRLAPLAHPSISLGMTLSLPKGQGIRRDRSNGLP